MSGRVTSRALERRVSNEDLLNRPFTVLALYLTGAQFMLPSQSRMPTNLCDWQKQSSSLRSLLWPPFTILFVNVVHWSPTDDARSTRTQSELLRTHLRRPREYREARNEEDRFTSAQYVMHGFTTGRLSSCGGTSKSGGNRFLALSSSL